MLGFNHIAGGLAFTGIFASFADINIFEQPGYIAVTVFASLLADIDHTKSPAGKLFYPLAKWIDRKYGHRTITHSFLFYITLVALVGVFEMLVFNTRVHTFLFAPGYGSHLLFDMCTRQGIPLFLPFTRAKCVLPGNPDLRLSTRSITSEIFVFFGFIALLLTTMPLMANGFWTTYNKAFSTFAHLNRENKDSKDVLYLITEQGLAGNVVTTTDKNAILYTDNQFKQTTASHTIKTFTHTNKRSRIVRIEFDKISLDSMRAIIAMPVISLKASTNRLLSYKQEGQAIENKTIELAYTTGFDFNVIEDDTSDIYAKVVALQQQVYKYQQIAKAWQLQHMQKQKKLENMVNTYSQVSEYEQGKLIEEIQNLKNEIAADNKPETDVEIEMARAEIAHLRLKNYSVQPVFTGVVTIWKM